MLFYDSNVMGVSNPDFLWGKNKTIFEDQDKLINTLEMGHTQKQFDSLLLDDTIGYMIDPYRDGRAKQRIGFYINNLMKELDNPSHTHDVILETVKRAYEDKFQAEPSNFNSRISDSLLGR